MALTLPLAGCGQKGPLVLPDGDSSGAPAASDDEEESAAARAARGGDGTGNGADGR